MALNCLSLVFWHHWVRRREKNLAGLVDYVFPHSCGHNTLPWIGFLFAQDRTGQVYSVWYPSFFDFSVALEISTDLFLHCTFRIPQLIQQGWKNAAAAVYIFVACLFVGMLLTLISDFGLSIPCRHVATQKCNRVCI